MSLFVRMLFLITLGIKLVACTPSSTPINVSHSYDGTKKGFTKLVEEIGRAWPPPDEIGRLDGDGASLRYARWRSPRTDQPPAGVVVFFSGRTEFIEKNIYSYQQLLKDNYDVWTLDWRGQGLSDRLIADQPDKGHIDSFATYVSDAEEFLTKVVKIDEIDVEQKILLAHSMGGAIATLYLIDHPTQFDKAVFSSPLMGLPWKVDNPIIRILNALKTLPAIGRQSCAGSPFTQCDWQSELVADFDPCAFDMRPTDEDFVSIDNSERFSHDKSKLQEVGCLMAANRSIAGNGPNLALGGSTSGWLRAAFEASDRIQAERQRFQTPTLIVGAGEETVVANSEQTRFCEAEGVPCCRIEIAGAGHEILIEDEEKRRQFWSHFERFVETDQPAREFCQSLSDQLH